MKVFVTGGTGFVGSHIVVELVRRGHEVTILARNPDKIPAFGLVAGISFVCGDMEDVPLIRASLADHDACVHTAILWDDEPTELELRDTRASVRLFEAAADAGVGQMIYTSSTAVHRPFKAVMSEEDALAPDDLYGSTKLAGEAFLSAFSHQTAMRCNVIRAAPVVGGPAAAGGPVKSHRRIEELVLSARLADEIHVETGSGRQFVSASDLATLFCAVLESGVNRGVYLAADRRVTTWEEIARMAVNACGSNCRVISKPGSQPGTFDVGKIHGEFGLVFDSSAAMREHIAWHCQGPAR